MTLMLARVARPEEVEAALAAGVDMIGLAEGHDGATAPADARAALDLLANRAPLSARAGAAGAPPAEEAARLAALAQAGCAYVEALATRPPRPEQWAAMVEAAGAARLIGVVDAGAPVERAVVEAIAAAGFHGAMLDLARAARGRLLGRRTIAEVEAFVRACREAGLACWLAGGLEAPDAPRLLPLAPDVLVFGAALRSSRDGGLDPQRLRTLRALVPRRRPPQTAQQPARAIDRVFVRDFVVEASVGAYADERARPQRLRFNVDVDVQRPSVHRDDMRDVFSYDVIVDAIRLRLARGHVAMVETLAEDIAAVVMASDLAMRVCVRVEKLDVIAGAVGVEIIRARESV
jgi:FolB domain-containing protein